MSTQPTSIRISRQIKDALKAEAKKRRWSVSTLINEILEAWLRGKK